MRVKLDIDIESNNVVAHLSLDAQEFDTIKRALEVYLDEGVSTNDLYPTADKMSAHLEKIKIPKN
jgi:hypothetical protein